LWLSSPGSTTTATNFWTDKNSPILHSSSDVKNRVPVGPPLGRGLMTALERPIDVPRKIQCRLPVVDAVSAVQARARPRMVAAAGVAVGNVVAIADVAARTVITRPIVMAIVMAIRPAAAKRMAPRVKQIQTTIPPPR
jgi:hypothetical protein